MTRLAVLLALVGGALAVGQPPARQQYIPDGDLGGRCLSCHSVGPTEFTKDSGTFVLLRETNYWNGHDLHRRAFDALSSDLGKQIGERLPGKPDVTTHAACLVCHATDTRPGTPLSDHPPGRFGGQYGVNCQACHGPGDGWNGKHQGAEWRTWPPAEKAALGLANLRDAGVRAAKCVSCHVGNVAEGKFVTHAMYAAGHPPLPAFELATFSRDEPKHWRAAKDVPHIAGLDPAAAKARFSHRPGEVEAARLAAVGAVTALRETARLAAAAPAGQPLDYAHFNCAACHHELVVPSDRQRNGFPGPAGRPVPTTWPVWAVRATLREGTVKDAAGGFEAAYDGWRKAFDAVPFGDPAAVGPAAKSLAEACDGLLARLDAATFDEAAARRLIAALTAESPGGRRDYLDADGAGHVARAAASIAAELEPSAAMGERPAAPPTFAGRFAKLNELVGLGVREAADNKPLLYQRGAYAGRAERAFRYRLGDFRTALEAFARP